MVQNAIPHFQLLERGTQLLYLSSDYCEWMILTQDLKRDVDHEV